MQAHERKALSQARLEHAVECLSAARNLLCLLYTSTLFMKESSFSVCDDYRRSWAFIKTELHSLERYSNFGIELPPRKTATLQPNR